ncbi:hypothetical protein CD122_08650 [Staphylococcus rostri]|uniref:YSIRK Gram-positive signal peptide domain-containing protein n=1 Tax=Staphylococcus rostri TaxID=522262 RepID=A0A2K3YKX4_9STAP|nr:YSIRK-type signal peptide-containing protein [Staphylococcus rostri]PNZ26256.1 hypothetical protein CD122_08650 [Staphylococcus rostri]
MKSSKGNSKRLDFLPNIQNKYSIRKFTVGTASILVGATLVFGVNNDAHAQEVPSQSQSSDSIEVAHTTPHQNEPVETEISTPKPTSESTDNEIVIDKNVTQSENTSETQAFEEIENHVETSSHLIKKMKLNINSHNEK